MIALQDFPLGFDNEMEDRQQTIEYRPVLLTYLDVLGFRDRIDKTKRNPSEVKETYDLLRRLQQQYSQSRRFVTGPDKKPHSITHFRSFSDLMLRITEVRRVCDPLADAYTTLGTNCPDISISNF